MCCLYLLLPPLFGSDLFHLLCYISYNSSHVCLVVMFPFPSVCCQGNAIIHNLSHLLSLALPSIMSVFHCSKCSEPSLRTLHPPVLNQCVPQFFPVTIQVLKFNSLLLTHTRLPSAGITVFVSSSSTKMVDSIATCFGVLFVCSFCLHLSVFTLQVPMLHPSSPIPCMLYLDTLHPLDSQLPVLQLVHLGIYPVSSVTRWTSLIYLQPCLHTACGFGQTSCRCYLLRVPCLTAFNANCNSFGNFWPVFFISVGKELIALSVSS